MSTYLEEVRARAGAATPGPWYAFIAHAREDIPELLRRLEAAELAIEAVLTPGHPHYLNLYCLEQALSQVRAPKGGP